MAAWRGAALFRRLTGRVRPTVRLRLALLSAALAVLAGAGVLTATYGLIAGPASMQIRAVVQRPETAACAAALGQIARAARSGQYPPPAAIAQCLPQSGPGSQALVIAHQARVLQQVADLRQFLIQGGIALAGLAIIAAAAGWWLAGAMLRPLQVITGRVRQLSAQMPLGRIRLAGPDDELKGLADTFDALLARLDAALAADRRFVANASHELRTPLAISETLLDVGLSDPDASVDSLREMGGRLRQVNARSKRLIEGLLTLASSQQGLGREEPVDLAAVARDAIEAAALQAERLTIRIETELSSAPVRGDPVLLERLAGNLIENAVRYNHDGGRVTVTTRAEPHAAVLTVANTGPPLDPAEVPGLFDPFRRGARDRTDSHRGAGLGLSIVRAVAEAHGGSVQAEVGPQGGLVVTVRLPPAADPADKK